MSICTSWGRYPQIPCQKHRLYDLRQLESLLQKNFAFIARGNGRSYGDSALAPNILDITPQNCFLDFDENTGLLHVQAGVLLSDIIDIFVPRGWFLKVTPGTSMITVGGAIAADVHGKNHHIDGCFSDWVKEFTLMLPDGEIVVCDPQRTPDLWRATCGGMGLTGVILTAKIYLQRITSAFVRQTVIKTRSLMETFEAFEANSSSPYSVAWIDCLAEGRNLGRSLLMLGEFENDGDFSRKPRRRLSVPFTLPGITLNKFTVKFFNLLYYNKVRENYYGQRVSLDNFFYPLDAIMNWNRIYGRKGFIQYQFILPLKSSYEGMEEILHAISRAGQGSFLAVLKLHGDSNHNWLSFPMKGYSLALDFKLSSRIFDLLKSLDEIVVKYGGRFYLAKDSRIGREVFERGYPDIEKFRSLRKEYDMFSKFQSLQAQRVGI